MSRSLAGLRFLVVEDAADIRDAFTVLLELEGASVVATGSGREAAERAAGAEFDVLLTDLGLPDLPGDVLIRRILATSPVRPRVIVVTGYSEPYSTRALDAGADVVLVKPIDWNDLLDQLQRPRVATDAVAA